MRKGILRSTAFALLAFATGSATAQVDLAPFLNDYDFNDVELSPTGEYYAATVPFEDRTSLVVVRRADSQPLIRFSQGKDTHVGSFHWVSPTRLVLGMAQKFGQLEKPVPTGELFAVDADGGKTELLVGYTIIKETGSRIGGKKAEDVAAFLLDDLPQDDRQVLVEIQPFSREPMTRVDRMDVYTGRRVTVARVDIPFADFTTDNAGEVRFAEGLVGENFSRLLYRKDGDSPWTVVNDQSASKRVESALGFAADNRTAYLLVEQASGPDAIIAYDTETGSRRQLLRDEVVDPYALIEGLSRKDGLVGARFLGASRHNRFFDPKSPDAQQYAMLERSFPGRNVAISSVTADGSLAMVQVDDATSAGDFYLFDTRTKAANYFASRTRVFDPKAMGRVRPVSLEARDGTKLHGFLTLPPGSTGQDLPTVVMPHGGPIEIYDNGRFDPMAQLLAHAGYAVLQVNFRGSGNYGRAFMDAGARQWGRRMQDDVTDATRWLIAQNIADSSRICLHGASYGAYAALMGVATEPALYRCASGYVGVYDLPLMLKDDAARYGRRTKIENRDWVGTDTAALAAVSPANLADRIKVPVLLVAGNEDKIAPPEQTRRMEAALKKAGVPVQAIYVGQEAHGFYTQQNRRDFYTRLLAFLSANIGGKVAK